MSARKRWHAQAEAVGDQALNRFGQPLIVKPGLQHDVATLHVRADFCKPCIG